MNKTPLFEWAPGVPTALNDEIEEGQPESDGVGIADNEDEPEVMILNNEHVPELTEDDESIVEDSDINSIEEEDILDDESDTLEANESNENLTDESNQIPIEAHEDNENDIQSTEDVTEGTLRRSTRSKRSGG